MHIVLIERHFLQKCGAGWAQGDFGIEIGVASFGVHSDTTGSLGIVEADVLRLRSLVFADMPLADRLRDIALLDSSLATVILPFRPPGSPYIGGRKMP